MAWVSDQERVAKAKGQNNEVIILPFGSAIQEDGN
jgi:hypothetical protein